MSARPRGRYVVLLAVLAGAGCATTTAPAGYLPDTRAAQTNTYGGWIDVTLQGDQGPDRVMGELIAATADTLWVLPSSGPGREIPTRTVMSGKVVGYDSNPGAVSTATFLGVLSTVSNGAFLILTAPAWIIVGAFAASDQSKLPVTKLPPATWEEVATFARFPQGMPAGVSLASLAPRRWNTAAVGGTGRGTNDMPSKR